MKKRTPSEEENETSQDRERREGIKKMGKIMMSINSPKLATVRKKLSQKRRRLNTLRSN